MTNFDISQYVEMALRRKWWIILPFLLAILGGLIYALGAPKIYEARTLILIQSQKVPTSFVKPIVSSGIEDRLRTISQQVTSRTNLEAIIKEYGILADRDMLPVDKVETVRKRIILDVVRGGRGGGNAFSIAYRDSNPQLCMRVANALASNFISENLKIRESQALGTSDFLADELENVRRRLAEKEEVLKQYRQRYMGALPNNLQTNLSVLARLQSQVEQLNDNLRDAENRKLIIQQQIAQSRSMMEQMADLGADNSLIELDDGTGPDQGESQELASLRKQLKLLLTRYTENHPDVVKVKTAIAKLEQAEKEEREKAEKEMAQKEAEGADTEEAPEEAAPPAPALPGTGDFLTPQLEQVDFEIRKLKEEIKQVQRKMAMYQKRIEDTPKREQEMISLTRDYDNLKSLYESLLNRKLEAEIAVSMEKKQKGEQFRVIDPARLPEKPVEPDARKILLLSLVLGLALGGGLAYLVEMMDHSYKGPKEVEEDLGIPVLVSMPIRYTEKEMKARKRKAFLAYATVSLGFVLSAMAIVMAYKGVERTVQFVKETLGLVG